MDEKYLVGVPLVGTLLGPKQNKTRPDDGSAGGTGKPDHGPDAATTFATGCYTMWRSKPC